jgi:hypothetical protein
MGHVFQASVEAKWLRPEQWWDAYVGVGGVHPETSPPRAYQSSVECRFNYRIDPLSEYVIDGKAVDVALAL